MEQTPSTASSTPLVAFAKSLRHWRTVRGLSQAGLAALVHVHRDLIAKIERTRRWPRHDLVMRLDQVLNAGGDLVRRWPQVESQRTRERLIVAQARIARHLEAMTESHKL